MPSIYSHYLCGDKILDTIEDNNIKKVINSYRNVFNLGTQGPDIFFYYRVWPWTHNLGINQIGDRLHTEKVFLFFSKALEYLNMQSGSKCDVISAYLYGYISHYALDLNAHPYIFYKTGFSLPGEPDDPKYACNHREFETDLDVLMVNRLLFKDTRDIKPHKLIEIDSQNMIYIEEMYYFILKSVYDIKLSKGVICQCIKDMIKVQSVLFDRFGFKKKALYSLEKLMGNLPLISSMIHFRKIDNSVDYLNISQSPWYFPWDNSDMQITSFTDIFDHAVGEGAGMCDDFSVNSKSIWNRSFTSGVDCDADIEFRYFEK